MVVTELLETLIRNEYFYFVLILAIFAILTRIVHFILVRYLKGFADRTETDIDDIILRIITLPLSVSVIFTGLYFALKPLTVLKPYSELIDRIFFVGTVLLLALIVSRILCVLIGRWLEVQKKYEKMPKLMSHIVAIIVYLIAVLMILQYFAIEITPLIAAFGVGGIVIALALQDTLSNVFAGLHIITDQPINVGDYVEIEGAISGYVEDINWRSTRLRTLPNTFVIVPNSKLANSIIINNSLPVLEMSTTVQCGVAYDSDLDKVEKVTFDVAKKIQETVPGAVSAFEPLIRFHTFGDSNINFSVILRVEQPVAKYVIMHEFIKALKARFDEEGIEISWPVRKIYYAK